MSSLEAMPPPVADARIEQLLAHSAWMGGLARQLVADPGTADDLVQKTWLAALEHRAKAPDDRLSLRRWLATVLRNFARQERRGSARRAEHEQRASRGEAQPSASDVVARASVQREVVQAVLGLDEPYRTTILLRFFDHLPPRSIARQMNVPVATVRTRIARGLDRLRGRLDDGRSGDRGAWLAALAPIAHLTPPPTAWAPGLSTPLGAVLLNAKIQIAVVVLVLGGALTYFLASRPTTAAERSPVAQASAPIEVPVHAARSAAPSAIEPELAPTTPGRAPAPMARADAIVAEIAASPVALRGRVLDGRGSPLAGVRVAIEGSDGRRTTDSVTSLQDGTFEMTFPSTGGRLVSSDDRFETVFAGLVGGPPSGSGKAGTALANESYVVVVAPRVEISGRVVGEEGYPLSGARIRIEVPEQVRTRFQAVLDRSVLRDWSATADEQGSFSIPAAPRLDGARLAASDDGYTPFFGPLAEHFGAGLVITLSRPRSEDGVLRGRVLDAAGTPVADARVAFGIDLARTESDGAFAFPLVDPDSFANRFRVPPTELVAVAKGFQPARYAPPVVDGNPSWPASVVLRLGEAALSIEGHVVDAHGDPFSGAKVWIADATLLGASRSGPVHLENVLAGDEDTNWRRVDADASGRFRIEGLQEREYRLRAMDGDTLLIGEAGPFPAGSMNVEIRLPTDELYEKVAGRVLSHRGQPIAGVHVFPMCDAFQAKLNGRTVSTSHDALDGTTTDAEGRFELRDVPKSLVYLRVQGDEILPLEYGRYVEGDPRFERTAVRSLPTERIERLEIVVDTRCHLQVELADPSTADAVAVLDAEGRELVLNVFVGTGRREVEHAEIVDGRSYPMAVPDTGRTIVLFKGVIEVSRVSVELVPGELKQVKL
jgi:RNA polymerase sigma factor (sigma-70 family)